MSDQPKKGLRERAAGLAEAAKAEAIKGVKGPTPLTPEETAQRQAQAAATERARQEGAQAAQAQQRQALEQRVAAGHANIQYHVDQIRESLIGDKVKTSTLATLLAQRAAEGWTLKQVVPASVEGRIGPGSAQGFLVIFERPLLR